MIAIGRKIYYELSTGNVILNTGEHFGAVIEKTIDQDFESWHCLKERVRETVGCIQLEYGQYAQDFNECISYRVNPETKAIEFSYPDPTAPTAEPVYQKPLTEEIAEIKQTLADIQQTLTTP